MCDKGIKRNSRLCLLIWLDTQQLRMVAQQRLLVLPTCRKGK
jgi:hypothetical protein